MTILDGPLRAATAAVFDSLGASATLIHVTRGDHDPPTGSSTETPSSEPWKVIVGSASSYGFGGTSFGALSGSRPAGEVARSDLTVFGPAQGLASAPAQNDKLTIGGKTYRIVQVRPVYSGDEIALYEADLGS